MAKLQETTVSRSITVNTDPVANKSKVVFDSTGIIKGDGSATTTGDDQTFTIWNKLRGPTLSGAGTFINDVVVKTGYNHSGMYYDKSFTFSAKNGFYPSKTTTDNGADSSNGFNLGTQQNPWNTIYLSRPVTGTSRVLIGVPGLYAPDYTSETTLGEVLSVKYSSTGGSGFGEPAARSITLGKRSSGCTLNLYGSVIYLGCSGEGIRISSNGSIIPESGNSTIGNNANPLSAEYVKTLYVGVTNSFSTFSQTSYGLSVKAFQSSMYPSTNSTSTSTGLNLGNTSYKWRYLYAYSGAIQSSDKSAKDSIHYLDSSISPRLRSASTVPVSSGVTTQDVIDFCKSIRPVTFCYKDGNGEATEENSKPEMIQLGLIADDLSESSLFKYIGVENEVLDIDEKGNPIEGTEHTSRGLQLLPLTVAALTACKNLISRVEELESKLNS